MGWFSKKKNNDHGTSCNDDNTYICEVTGCYGHMGVKSSKFKVQLGAQDYYDISGFPTGEAAERLAFRLCPSMTEFQRVYLTKP